MDPGFVEAHLYLGWVYEQKGMFTDAIAELRQALSISGGHPRFVSALGHAYARASARKAKRALAARSVANRSQDSSRSFQQPRAAGKSLRSA